MNYIKLNNVSVSYPVFNYYKQSIKLKAIQVLTGGTITRHNNIILIEALKNINLEIKQGEKIGLYGHNGSGKTTLLRTIAGIYEPIKGMVEVKGNITSMLSINLGINEFESGLSNIKLKAKFLKLNNKETAQMIEKVTEFSELDDFINMPVCTYSSGMNIRLMFALATYSVTDILLLDEWLSAGDEAFAPKAESKMQEIVKKSGILVLASHNKKLLEKICNRIIYLEKGLIKNIE
jgi:lipopolysaccharide transport system ATP-binding protein